MDQRWFGLALAVASAGCGRVETESSSYQIGDTTVVFSAEPARDTATLREVLRIGEAEGAPKYMFAQISRFTVGPNGNVFVAQSDEDLRRGPLAPPRRDTADLGWSSVPGLTDPLFRGDTVWAITKDALDLRYISKFVVEWPS